MIRKTSFIGSFQRRAVKQPAKDIEQFALPDARRCDRRASAKISERSYLFTMSDIARALPVLRQQARKTFSCERAKTPLVEPDGIEPTTSCLQSRRSPN
jgi:hypothetical protein